MEQTASTPIAVLTPTSTPGVIGTDEIAVAFIYKTATVCPRWALMLSWTAACGLAVQ